MPLIDSLRPLLFAWFTVLSLPVHGAARDLAEMRLMAADWLARQVEQTYPDSLAQVEMGALDSRLRLGACNSPQFFLPAGSSLWSGGSLGMKCAAPAKWTLYLTYRVRLTGPSLTALRPLPARHMLGAADVTLSNVRYEQDPGSYLREIPVGASTQRPMSAGQPIQVHDLLLPSVVQAGAQVRVRVEGAGFSVAQEGKALNAAQAGGTVQVRMPSGRIVRGMATQAGEVMIRP